VRIGECARFPRGSLSCRNNTRVLIKRLFSCGHIHISRRNTASPRFAVECAFQDCVLAGENILSPFPPLSIPTSTPLWIPEAHKKFRLDFPRVVYQRKLSGNVAVQDSETAAKMSYEKRENIPETALATSRRDAATTRRLQVRGIVISYLHACF